MHHFRRRTSGSGRCSAALRIPAHATASSSLHARCLPRSQLSQDEVPLPDHLPLRITRSRSPAGSRPSPRRGRRGALRRASHGGSAVRAQGFRAGPSRAGAAHAAALRGCQPLARRGARARSRRARVRGGLASRFHHTHCVFPIPRCDVRVTCVLSAAECHVSQRHVSHGTCCASRGRHTGVHRREAPCAAVRGRRPSPSSGRQGAKQDGSLNRWINGWMDGWTKACLAGLSEGSTSRFPRHAVRPPLARGTARAPLLVPCNARNAFPCCVRVCGLLRHAQTDRRTRQAIIGASARAGGCTSRPPACWLASWLAG